MTEILVFVGAIITTGALFWGLIWVTEKKTLAELKLEQQTNDLEKLRETIEADGRAREQFARGGLLEDDGHKRD